MKLDNPHQKHSRHSNQWNAHKNTTKHKVLKKEKLQAQLVKAANIYADLKVERKNEI